MSDLTLGKIKNMLGAHNDGVYRLEARENLGEIVGWLVRESERLRQSLTELQQVLTVPAAEYLPAITDAWDIIERANKKGRRDEKARHHRDRGRPAARN